MILIIVLCLGIIALGIYVKKIEVDEVCSVVVLATICALMLFFMLSGIATGIFAKQEVVVKEYNLSPIYENTYVEVIDRQGYHEHVRCNYFSNEPLGYIETTIDSYREDIVRTGEENKLFVVQYEFKYKLIKAIFTEIGFVKWNVIEVVEVGE